MSALEDNGFLYMLVTVLIEIGLLWLLVHLAFKLIAGIREDETVHGYTDTYAAAWCLRPRGSNGVRHRMQQLRGKRLAGDPVKVAEFQRLCWERRIGARI